MARSSNDPHLQRIFLELEKQWLSRAEEVEERPRKARSLRHLM
jgi:hypothetical protein